MSDIEYTFKHALTQEVAYNSVLAERRRILHARAAQAIETLCAERLEDHLTELAHHYDRSGNRPKALQYLARAGAKAAQQMAHSEAVGYLSRGLELLKQLPDSTDRDRQELDLQEYYGVSLYMTLGPGAPRTAEAALRKRELSERLGDDRNLMAALLNLTSVYISRREFPKAREVAEQALVMSEGAGDLTGHAQAHSQLANVLYCVGQFDGARQQLELALESPERARGIAGEVAPGVLATVLLLLGYPTASLEKGRESIDSARRLSEPVSLARALVNDAMRHALLRDCRRAMARAEEVLTLGTQHEMAFYEARATFFRGWAIATAEDGEDGIAEMRRGLSALAAGGALIPLFMAILADHYAKIGLHKEGLAAVAEALGRATETGERMAEAELHRLNGELLTMGGLTGEDQVEHCFREAIDVARSQKAKFWELRATASLARLLKKQGKADEARQILVAIYNWFTEGFDTADLKDAKALLDDLES